ncbi:MAG: hypothetical protein U0451_03585 [Candidatus Saccharimonadales bacterium]
MLSESEEELWRKVLAPPSKGDVVESSPVVIRAQYLPESLVELVDDIDRNLQDGLINPEEHERALSYCERLLSCVSPEGEINELAIQEHEGVLEYILPM